MVGPSAQLYNLPAFSDAFALANGVLGGGLGADDSQVLEAVLEANGLGDFADAMALVRDRSAPGPDDEATRLLIALSGRDAGAINLVLQSLKGWKAPSLYGSHADMRRMAAEAFETAQLFRLPVDKPVEKWKRTIMAGKPPAKIGARSALEMRTARAEEIVHTPELGDLVRLTVGPDGISVPESVLGEVTQELPGLELSWEESGTVVGQGWVDPAQALAEVLQGDDIDTQAWQTSRYGNFLTVTNARRHKDGSLEAIATGMSQITPTASFLEVGAPGPIVNSAKRPARPKMTTSAADNGTAGTGAKSSGEDAVKKSVEALLGRRLDDPEKTAQAMALFWDEASFYALAKHNTPLAAEGLEAQEIIEVVSFALYDLWKTYQARLLAVMKRFDGIPLTPDMTRMIEEAVLLEVKACKRLETTKRHLGGTKFMFMFSTPAVYPEQSHYTEILVQYLQAIAKWHLVKSRATLLPDSKEYQEQYDRVIRLANEAIARLVKKIVVSYPKTLYELQFLGNRKLVNKHPELARAYAEFIQILLSGGYANVMVYFDSKILPRRAAAVLGMSTDVADQIESGKFLALYFQTPALDLEEAELDLEFSVIFGFLLDEDGDGGK